MSAGHVGLKKYGTRAHQARVSSSTTKSGRSLYFSETMFLGKIFQELMVFGHFGPRNTELESCTEQLIPKEEA